MSDTPSAHEVVIAATTLRHAVTAALADPNPLPGRIAIELAALLVTASDDVHWARDAALELARRSGFYWSDIADASGRADSTLQQRHARWIAQEGPR